jgi:hypothetical protein
MKTKEYVDYQNSRLQRAEEMRSEVPNRANEVRVISTPPALVRAGQEYLRRQRDQSGSVSENRSPQQ